MTGRPDVALPEGWDMIPGARGCTPQSCAFRDHFAELKALGAQEVFGLSTQSTAYQQEAAERLHLPFALLSDEKLRLTEALCLPTSRPPACACSSG
jgi:peroxiredoxin (alkyl hydroperoxide reductase subunit C)